MLIPELAELPPALGTDPLPQKEEDPLPQKEDDPPPGKSPVVPIRQYHRRQVKDSSFLRRMEGQKGRPVAGRIDRSAPLLMLTTPGNSPAPIFVTDFPPEAHKSGHKEFPKVPRLA